MRSIIVDIDVTSVSTDVAWFDFLNRAAGYPYKTILDLFENGQIDYDLGKYFPSIPREEQQAFWSDPYLYQNLKPRDGVVNALTWMLDNDIRPVFASHVSTSKVSMDTHFTSKRNFIKDLMKPIANKDEYGIVITNQKHDIVADGIIDDRHKFLNQFVNRKDFLPIKMFSLYTQDEPVMVANLHIAMSWVDIPAILCGFDAPAC